MSRKIYPLYFAAAAVIGSLFQLSPVFAQTGGGSGSLGGTVTGGAGLPPIQSIASNVNDIKTILCNIFDVMFWVLMIVSIIMVLWAAYIYVTAGDDTEKTSKARRTITYAAVAIVVALVAKTFPQIVADVFGQSNAVSQWAC